MIIIKNGLFLSKKINKSITLLTNIQKCADELFKPLSHLSELWIWHFLRTLVIRRHNSIKEILNYDQRCKHVNINECKLHCGLLHGYCLKVANKTPESAPCTQVFFTICPLCSPPLVFCPLPAERQISKLTATLSTWSTAETANAPDSPTPFSDASINISAENSPDREGDTCDH